LPQGVAAELALAARIGVDSRPDDSRAGLAVDAARGADERRDNVGGVPGSTVGTGDVDAGPGGFLACAVLGAAGGSLRGPGTVTSGVGAG